MKVMRKLLLSLGVVFAFIAYTWQQRHEMTTAIIAPSTSTSQSQTVNSSKSQSPSNTNMSQNNHATMMAKYKDGQYVGDEADAFYGLIQVKAIVNSGKITDVQFLEYPNDRQNSIFINQQAMPMLKEEAIKSQSAHVDIITGATDTSNAFIESLNYALNKAV